MTEIRFPEGFIFGTATSSFQIEGRSPDIPQGDSIWDTFCAEPGRIADGSDGLVACDHINRWDEDVELMDELNMGAYRFSIAWPRVLPNGTGDINQAGLDFYDQLVDALLARGITPMPTLYHWDLPQSLQENGGWLTRSTSEAFADYTEVVLSRLGDRIDTWMTLNEPMVSAALGHVMGIHAPGHRSQTEGFAAAHHLLLGHGLAMERIRELAPKAEAGIVLNFTPAVPATESAADAAAAAITNGWENEWYIHPIRRGEYPAETVEALGWDQSEVHDGDLDIISAPIDLLGINFYTRYLVSAINQGRAVEPKRTEMGWEIHAPALRDVLVWLHNVYDLPKIMITENGAAMPDLTRVDGRVHDLDRIEYLHDHLAMVREAIDAGVPMVGYLAWSFMDNFEWAEGYLKRFGLVEVEPGTLRRIPKSSALWFAEVARTGVLPAVE